MDPLLSNQYRDIVATDHDRFTRTTTLFARQHNQHDTSIFNLGFSLEQPLALYHLEFRFSRLASQTGWHPDDISAIFQRRLRELKAGAEVPTIINRTIGHSSTSRGRTDGDLRDESIALEAEEGDGIVMCGDSDENEEGGGIVMCDDSDQDDEEEGIRVIEEEDEGGGESIIVVEDEKSEADEEMQGIVIDEEGE